MGARDRAGFIKQIVTNGTLDVAIATVFTTYGPCDALKADKDVTVNGTPADANTETVTSYKIQGNFWDPVGWQAITAVTGSGANVWAAWYSRKPQ